MERKIGCSEPFTIKVPRNDVVDDGLTEIPQDQLLDIPVRFLYVEDEVNYAGDNYWYYNEKDDTVYVKINNESRLRYLDCMKKKLDGHELSREEELIIEDFEVIAQSVSEHAANEAKEQFLRRMELYSTILSEKKVDEDDTEEIVEIIEPKNGQEAKKDYRTKNKAGVVDEVPSYVPAITNSSYQNAMTLNTDNKAYLQPLSSADNLVFENGQLLFEGMPASAATLKRYFTQDGIEAFNLPLLRVFYAVILNRFIKTWNEDKSVEEVVTIYYPDLAKQLGKSTNVSQKDVDECINNIISFQTIMGIVDKGKRGNDILPVLVYMGNDVEKNTISFASPYMVRVIRDLYNASIRKNKQGLPLLKKNGEPQMLPSYSYMIKSSIAKEKNKKAVEIVFIVVALIEQCGNNEPHIKASTIIERNQLLRQAIENAKTLSNVNTQLQRSFTKAWELLSTQTELATHYKNIQLPNPKAKDFNANWIPTSATLDKVFVFKHDGKK